MKSAVLEPTLLAYEVTRPGFLSQALGEDSSLRRTP
jgi:hypothetical protein